MVTYCVEKSKTLSMFLWWYQIQGFFLIYSDKLHGIFHLRRSDLAFSRTHIFAEPIILILGHFYNIKDNHCKVQIITFSYFGQKYISDSERQTISPLGEYCPPFLTYALNSCRNRTSDLPNIGFYSSKKNRTSNRRTLKKKSNSCYH